MIFFNFLRKLKWMALVTFLVLSIFLLLSNLYIIKNKKYTTATVEKLQDQYACLVLGTSRNISGGQRNLFYANRIDAVVKLYEAGKCKKIVVSGDNRHANYNEPEDMKNSLVGRGISAKDIFCDYAGTRTLDSILRFKAVFGQNSGIVVSQQFHNERAVYIARSNGVELMGFNADDVDAYIGFKTRMREILSKGMAVLDVEVLHSRARHYGPKIII